MTPVFIVLILNQKAVEILQKKTNHNKLSTIKIINAFTHLEIAAPMITRVRSEQLFDIFIRFAKKVEPRTKNNRYVVSARVQIPLRKELRHKA